MRKTLNSFKIVGIIPARFASTRFPGKVLTQICRKPMVQWVYERVSDVAMIDAIYVATDDDRIRIVVQQFGGNVIMTSPHHASGTDRIAEAAADLDTDIVVNVQADEPLISPKAVEEVLEPFFTDQQVVMTTLCRKTEHVEELFNSNTVRVVFDRNYNALFFSRSPIPYNRDKEKSSWLDDPVYYQHIGVYAFRKSFLHTYSKLPQTPLEKVEQLEQLRVLESGFPMRVVETQYFPVCVDIPDDVEKVEQFIKNKRKIDDSYR